MHKGAACAQAHPRANPLAVCEENRDWARVPKVRQQQSDVQDCGRVARWCTRQRNGENTRAKVYNGREIRGTEGGRETAQFCTRLGKAGLRLEKCCGKGDGSLSSEVLPSPSKSVLSLPRAQGVHKKGTCKTAGKA